MEGNPHQGHRRRMLDKFGRLGVDAFADHELLEVLLYCTINISTLQRSKAPKY